MLKGIDVSSWNGKPFNNATENGYSKSDFIIAKATEGTNYVNPYCDYAIQRAIKDDKLFGFYHYAAGGNPEKEAEYFYNNCKGYVSKGIPALDWESTNNPQFGDNSWCRRFVDKFHAISGVWPIIYVQQSAISQVANCANNCGLWVAHWGVSSPGNVSPWQAFTVWQWTSNNGKLDENYANVTKAQWLAIAKGETVKNEIVESPTVNANNAKNIDLDTALTRVALAVIDGKYGNGETRKNNLYNAVQTIVNRLV